MTTKEIIFEDLRCLQAYLNCLPYGEQHSFFVRVCEKSHIDIKTTYNWRYGRCRIPEACKRDMEQIAGRQIFTIRK